MAFLKSTVSVEALQALASARNDRAHIRAAGLRSAAVVLEALTFPAPVNAFLSSVNLEGIEIRVVCVRSGSPTCSLSVPQKCLL